MKYIEDNLEFKAQIRDKEDMFQEEFLQFMNALQEDRDLEDEETRYKFHLKREEIEDEKTKREEIEKLRILSVLDELKDLEKAKQEEVKNEEQTRMRNHQQTRDQEKALLEKADQDQRDRLASEHKEHNDAMFIRLMGALTRDPDLEPQ